MGFYTLCTVFEMQCVFHTQRTSPLRLATRPGLNGRMVGSGLLYWTDSAVIDNL